MALCSEANADIGEVLAGIRRYLDTMPIHNSSLEQAARILGGKLAEWRDLHATLASGVMKHSHTYEDAVVALEEAKKHLITEKGATLL
jgi:hypothetical protein